MADCGARLSGWKLPNGALHRVFSGDSVGNRPTPGARSRVAGLGIASGWGTFGGVICGSRNRYDRGHCVVAAWTGSAVLFHSGNYCGAGFLGRRAIGGERRNRWDATVVASAEQGEQCAGSGDVGVFDFLARKDAWLERQAGSSWLRMSSEHDYGRQNNVGC